MDGQEITEHNTNGELSVFSNILTLSDFPVKQASSILLFDSNVEVLYNFHISAFVFKPSDLLVVVENTLPISLPSN